MTLAEFYALILTLAARHRPKCAQAAYRYADLRSRGATRAAAREAVLSVRQFDDALRLAAVRDDFRSLT